jgi:hypothetical protein
MDRPVAGLAPLVLQVAHTAKGAVSASEVLGAERDRPVPVVCDRGVPDRPAVALLDSFVARVDREHQRPRPRALAKDGIHGFAGEIARLGERDALRGCQHHPRSMHVHRPQHMKD